MALIRKLFFWLHLFAGVVAGLVIFTMAATGVLLTYERQMVDWANRGLWLEPPAGTPRLPIGAILAKAQESQGGKAPVSVIWRSDTAAPVAISYGKDATIYVNAYTGSVLGEGARGWRSFFNFVTELHRWLAMDVEKRATGKAITGACNLAFLFIVLSGIFLWWPQQWRWKSIKAVIVFDRRLQGKARDWNWHNVLGFWASIPLVIIVATGSVISYPWAKTLLYRMAGSEPPAQNPGGPGPGPGGSGSGGPRRGEGEKGGMNFDRLDRMAAKAEQQVAGWQMITWRGSGSFMIDQSHRGRPDKRITLTLDPKSGDIVKEESFAGLDRGAQWQRWARFAHTGEVGGVIGQTLAGLASLAVTVLVYTGIALSLRRLGGWLKKKQNGNSATGPAPVNSRSPIEESAPV